MRHCIEYMHYISLKYILKKCVGSVANSNIDSIVKYRLHTKFLVSEIITTYKNPATVTETHFFHRQL